MKSPLDGRLLVVSGKGGVGKSTVAAAVAVVAAARGGRVLLCDMDGSGEPGRLLGASRSEYTPVEVQFADVGPEAGSVSVMSMDTESAIREYLATFTPFGALTRLRPLARALDLMGGAAPGVREVLAMGKLLWTIRRDEFDLVVMDGPATGHVLGHLDAPWSVGELAAGGLLGQQTGWMQDMLVDPEITSLVAVTRPEEGPIEETVELLSSLSDAGRVAIAGVVINRVPAPAGTRRDLEVLDALRASDVALLPGDAAAVVSQRLGVAALQNDAIRNRRHLDASLGELGTIDTWALPEVLPHDALMRAVDSLAEEW